MVLEFGFMGGGFGVWVYGGWFGVVVYWSGFGF